MADRKPNPRTKVGDPIRRQKVEAVCELLIAQEKGCTGMVQCCRKVGLPPGTFLSWCDEDPELGELYARADRIATDIQFAHFREVAEAEPERGKFGIDSGWVQRQRMIVDALKWELAHRHPERLGDKMQIGGDKGNPVVVKVEREELLGKLIGNRAAKNGPEVSGEAEDAKR